MQRWAVCGRRSAALLPTPVRPGHTRALTQLLVGVCLLVLLLSGGCASLAGRSNCDIKNLSRGCRVYLPVFVEGANLSMGDMHFSQGDGEVSFCGAIEMSGFLELR